MKVLCSCILLLLVGLGQAQAQDQKDVPPPLVRWTLLDQFDQPYTLNNDLQILLVARSMAGAKLLNEALEGRPKGYLEARQAMFLADVSRMPTIIANLFAVPAMRDYAYRVLLDRQPRVVPHYPGPTDSVLWLELDRGRVTGQRTFTSATQLRAALEQLML